MTGWTVERMPRTAFPSPVPPVGAAACMPPHSQGAERRGGRRSGRTGARWALRALVVGGLAGAAWLLTGAAAHAADPEPTSLLGSVVDGDTAPPAINRVLQAAARPLEPGRPAGTHDVDSSVVTAPVRVIAQPVRVVTETLSGTDDATAAPGAVDRVVRVVPGPLRLTGGPADSRPLAQTLRPATDLLQQPVAAPPVAAPPVAVPPVAAPPVAVPSDSAPAAPSGEPADAGAPDTRATGTAATGTDPVPDVRASGLIAGHRISVGPTGSVRQRHTIVADRTPAAATAARPGTVRENTPGGDGPVPLRAHLGAVGGIPSSVSGAPTEGGSIAVLPAAVVSGAMARSGLRDAIDVEARRHAAEAPTVSPD
jgi:hypothetical protein